MARQLLRSWFPIKATPETLNESKRENKGKIVLKGLIQKADTPNGNGRIYPRSLLEREVNKYKQVVSDNRALGELDHPPEQDWERDDPLLVRLDRASHIIRKIWMNGNDVHGEIQILSTPAGQILQALINDGVTVGISSRGFGSVEHNGSHSIVQPDIEISCWDMVWMPSTGKAFMESMINEGQGYFQTAKSTSLFAEEKIKQMAIKQTSGEFDDLLAAFRNRKR